MKYILNTALLFSVCLTSAPLVAEEAVQADTPYRLNAHLVAPPPISQKQEAYVPADLFGTKGGYVHPFMSVTLDSTDNINNTRTNEISDWKAVYSPGIWLAAPAQREIFLNLNTSNTSPGGHVQQMDKQGSFSRYQAYGLYAADIEEYHIHTERNTVNQSAEAFFQFNLRGGLSVDMYDKYSDSEDPMATGDSLIIDDYKSNIAGIIMDFEITEKVRIRADYTNFHLRYDEPISQGRDRDDDAYALYGYYVFSPKTSFFVQYGYVDVEYDLSSLQDNEQHSGYAGMDWQPTEKTAVKGKLGFTYRKSSYDQAETTSQAMELNLTHDFTVKTSIALGGSYKLNESTVSTASFSKDSNMSLAWQQMITEKIGFALTSSYTRSSFQGDLTQDRTDHLYSVSPTIKYVFKEWLSTELGYQYYQRNSNQDDFDYTTNTAFLRISAGF